MSSEKEFDEISKSVALKKYYTDEDQIGDEFCERVKCDACFGSDENGEPNGYGCPYRETYVDENDHLIVDYDEAYSSAKDELDEKEKEIERLKADINKAVELIEENNSILRNNHSIFHLNEEVINLLKQSLREVESE